MKRLIYWLFAITALTASFRPVLAAADIEGYTKGQELHHMLRVCRMKEDAIAVADLAVSDPAAASALFEASPTCDIVPVLGPRVGKVVHKSAEKGGHHISVVEILMGEKVIGYFLTAQTINAPADRNN